MRVLLLFSLLLSATLAGCLGDDDSSPEPLDAESHPSDPSVGAEASGEDPEGGSEGGGTSASTPTNAGPTLDEPVELASATLKWHEGDILEPFHIVTQPIASPCLFQGEGQEGPEPYFNNLHVSGRTAVKAMPPGTRSLEVTLDWAIEDYLGDALVLAYREDGAWRTSDYLPKGTSVVDVQDIEKQKHVNLWLCLRGDDEPNGSLGVTEPRFFAGNVTLTLRALGTNP